MINVVSSIDADLSEQVKNSPIPMDDHELYLFAPVKIRVILVTIGISADWVGGFTQIN
jgi:hypothetical protein